MRWIAPIRFAASKSPCPAARRHLPALAIAAMLTLSAWQAPAATATSKCGTAESARSDAQCVSEHRTETEASHPPVTLKTAKRALLERLTNPGSAVFRNVRMSPRLTKEGRPYAVCGEVDMKNTEGFRVGYTKFYVPDDLEPLIVSKSDAGMGALSEALWQTVCAGDDRKP